MNVSALGNLGGASAVAARSVNVRTGDNEAPGVGPAAVTKISADGDRLSRLHDLQTNDPAKFQAKMKEMAEHLRAMAKERGGAEEKKLDEMADKVDAAAASGDLSGLQPPDGARRARGPGGPPPGGRGGAPPAVGGANAGHGSSSSSSDPADKNGDGNVSAIEQAAYDLRHPNVTVA